LKPSCIFWQHSDFLQLTTNGFFFFKIFTQHEDKVFFEAPTIFVTFDYVVKKLLYDMYFFPVMQFGQISKNHFFGKQKFEIGFQSLFICRKL